MSRHIAEELVEGVLQIDGEDPQEFVELPGFAEENCSLGCFQRLQGAKCPDASVPKQDLHVEQVLLGQLMLQRG